MPQTEGAARWDPFLLQCLLRWPDVSLARELRARAVGSISIARPPHSLPPVHLLGEATSGVSQGELNSASPTSVETGLMHAPRLVLAQGLLVLFCCLLWICELLKMTLAKCSPAQSRELEGDKVDFHSLGPLVCATMQRLLCSDGLQWPLEGAWGHVPAFTSSCQGLALPRAVPGGSCGCSCASALPPSYVCTFDFFPSCRF